MRTWTLLCSCVRVSLRLIETCRVKGCAHLRLDRCCQIAVQRGWQSCCILIATWDHRACKICATVMGVRRHLIVPYACVSWFLLRLSVFSCVCCLCVFPPCVCTCAHSLPLFLHICLVTHNAKRAPAGQHSSSRTHCRPPLPLNFKWLPGRLCVVSTQSSSSTE